MLESRTIVHSTHMYIQMFTSKEDWTSGKTLGDWFGEVHFIYKKCANAFFLYMAYYQVTLEFMWQKNKIFVKSVLISL